MAATTGTILVIGGITLANETLLNGKPVDWKVPIATGVAALVFGFAERAVGPEIPHALATLALVAVIVTRVNPNVPSPVESASTWWNNQK